MTRTTIETLTRIFVGATLLLVLGTAVAAAQDSAAQGTDPEGVEPVPVTALTKICEGKWKSDGKEHVVSQVCPNVRDICTCTADKVKCGGGEISAPAGSTFCEGSCSTKWVGSAASQAQVELFADAFLKALLADQELYAND
jgi:hypothetical protein